MRSLALLAIPVVVLVAIVAIVMSLHRPTEAAPACVLDDCPFELTASSTGSAFVYRLTSRFTVILDGDLYPKAELSCTPEGILGAISNIPAVQAPLYAVRYDGIAPGTCTLRDRDFFAQITIVDPTVPSQQGE